MGASIIGSLDIDGDRFINKENVGTQRFKDWTTHVNTSIFMYVCIYASARAVIGTSWYG